MTENWGNRREIATAGGGNFTGLDFGDREVKFFKLKEGMNRIEIIPYTITTNMHPLVVQGRYQKGIVITILYCIFTGTLLRKRSIICSLSMANPVLFVKQQSGKRRRDKATNDALCTSPSFL